jgi:hypothetical protein
MPGAVSLGIKGVNIKLTIHHGIVLRLLMHMVSFLGSGALSGESVESKETSEACRQLIEFMLRKNCGAKGMITAEEQIIITISNCSKSY